MYEAFISISKQIREKFYKLREEGGRGVDTLMINYLYFYPFFSSSFFFFLEKSIIINMNLNFIITFNLNLPKEKSPWSQFFNSSILIGYMLGIFSLIDLKRVYLWAKNCYHYFIENSGMKKIPPSSILKKIGLRTRNSDLCSLIKQNL